MHLCRNHVGPLGFTLVEVMITVGIIGILASVAIPTFQGYKAKARAAEAYTHLAAMTNGIKAYYQQEYWAQGVVATVGGAGDGTHCRPATSSTSNWPTTTQKTVLNWDSEAASFRAIGFTPAEPLLFHYRMGPAQAYLPNGAGVYWSGNGNDCGNPASSTNIYDVEAAITPDGSTYRFIRWRICSNAENELFVCERVSSEECAVSFGRTSRVGLSVWALLLIGLCVRLRRKRRHAKSGY